jgi:hypothetical protein
MKNNPIKAEIQGSSQPFRFKKSIYLVEVVGQKARNLSEFMRALSIVDRSAIFFHLHQPMLVSPQAQLEYPNDFAYWMAKELGNYILAEKFANLEPFRVQDLEEIRRDMVSQISQQLVHEQDGKSVVLGREFVFCRARSIVLDSGLEASNLKEFRDALKRVDINSVYYHLVESKLRLGRKTNDFAGWLQAIGEDELANEAGMLDPYLTTLEGNRNGLIKLVEARVSGR